MRLGIVLVAGLVALSLPSSAKAQKQKSANAIAIMTQADLENFMKDLHSNLADWRKAVADADISTLHGDYASDASRVSAVQSTRERCLADLDHIKVMVENLSPVNLLLNIEVLHSLGKLEGDLGIFTLELLTLPRTVHSPGNPARDEDGAVLKGWGAQLVGAIGQVDNTDRQFSPTLPATP